MSAIDPNKRAIIEELNRRRSTLTPDKVKVLDELLARMNTRTMEPPGIPRPPLPEGLRPQQGSIDPTLQALTTGVPYDVVRERLLGGASSFVNTLLPGGSSRDERRTLPELTPDEQIGERIAAVSTVGPPVGGAVRSIIQGGARMTNLPERLMSGAASARSAVARTAPSSIPFTKSDALVQGIKATARPVVNSVSRVAEIIAKGLAKNDEARAILDRPSVFSGTPHEPVTPPQRMGYKPPENVPPVDPASGLFPGETRPKIGATRPQPRPIDPVSNPSFTAPDVNRWMNVQTKQMVHGANPGQQIIDDKLLAATKDATLANVDKALKATGEEMQAVLRAASQSGVRLNVEQTVINALDDATKTIGKRTDAGFQNALSNILDDILQKHPDMRDMTPEAVHALKVDIGDAVKWGRGAAYEADINQVLVEIYKSLNGNLKTAVPNIEALQSKWGNLYQGQKALRQSLLKDAIGRGTGAAPVKK